jgi:hypothetical protein
MSLDIKNLSHVEQDVGKTIKSTKKHFIWEFLLDGKTHKIELYDSRLSGKKKLIKDGQVFKEVQEDIAFSKSFEIGKHSCTIIQHGDKYELRVDNQSFGHLMDLEKNRVFFSGEANPTSTTYTSKAAPSNTKVGFGMGQMNFKAETGQRPSGLFNFAIKPQNNPGNNTGNNVNKKRFSEMPSHDYENKFGNNKDETGNNKPTTGNNTNAGNLLIDFSADNSTQNHAIATESKSSNNNPMNILDSIDFSATANTSNNNNYNNNNNNNNNNLTTNINSGNTNEVFNLVTNSNQFGNSSNNGFM